MKIAIIGASTGQKALCIKAKEKGLETIAFAWEEGAVCKSIVDRFYPISIMEKERIVELCRKEGVCGVLSNGSDYTAQIASYVASQLGLHGVSYDSICRIRNKYEVRQMTDNVEGLSRVRSMLYSPGIKIDFPCIVKPATGSGKKGVSYVGTEEDLNDALCYADSDNEAVLVEEYIPGQEFSVESISYEGKHYVLQISDRVDTSAPHFVELEIHQPSQIDSSIQETIRNIVPRILDAVGFDNSASHIEMRINCNSIYLIELNPRGAGLPLSDKLVQLSTGIDYLGMMIDVAIGKFSPAVEVINKCSGLFFLFNQTSYILDYIKGERQPWMIESEYDSSKGLNDATTNSAVSGYLIYQAERRIQLHNQQKSGAK